MVSAAALNDILLWAPMGAGLQYSGVGMSAHRLYRTASDASLFTGTLVHACPDQDGAGVFRREVRLGSVRGGILNQLGHLMRAESWLRRHRSQFGVFHGLSAYEMTLRPALLAQNLGLPAIVKIASHDGDLADKRSFASRLLRLPARRRRRIGQLAGVVATSREIADFLMTIDVPPDRVHRISNGVDCSRFHPISVLARARLREQLNLPDRPTIVFTGTVVPRKRPHLIIEALALLRRSGQIWSLAICGPESDPDYARSLQQRIDDYGLKDSVRWVGFTSTVEDWLQASDVYCLPSEREGMPNGVLEAMACGLPVIGTAISGIADLVNDGRTGYICSPSPHSVAESLSRYWVEPGVATLHGQLARMRTTQDYSLERIAKTYYELFSTLRSTPLQNL